MIRQILLKIDEFREYKLEDFIADNILAKIDESTKIDDLEQQAILTALTAGNAYLTTYGVPTIPDDVKTKIAQTTVKALCKANKLLQKQLKKKSKRYD